jgi:prepilin-type N-terminal cleavage/methylation domain-containing protein
MKNSRNGYTLVEVIVAAVLFAAAIAGTITILVRGAKVSNDDLVRVKAYGQLERVLESKTYSWLSYDSLKTFTTVQNPTTLLLDSIVLDVRQAGNLRARRWVTLNYGEYAAAGGNTQHNIGTLPAIKVKAFLAWQMDAAKTDTAMLETIITKP